MADRGVVERIASFNEGREPERLDLKFQAMSADSFAFFRGTCHLFYEDWPERTPLDKAPAAWICGDLHLENFGSYKGDNRLTYFDINDFDESALAPVTWDLARLVTSLRLASKIYGLEAETLRMLEKTCLAAYCEAAAAGKPRWIERQTATGLMARLLLKVGTRKRKAFLDSWTEWDSRQRQRCLRPIEGKTLPIKKAEKRKVEHKLRDIARREGGFYRPLDVLRRIAGTGSLGLGRYVVLVEGTGSPDHNYLIDLKETNPSALAPRLKHQPDLGRSDERVATLQRRLQAVAPALLRPQHFARRSWVLRELQPVEDRVNIAKQRQRPAELEALVHSFGALTAWLHLRGAGHQGAAIPDELMAFGHASRWRREIRDYAKGYAPQVQEDWKVFRRAYDAGAFAKMLPRK